MSSIQVAESVHSVAPERDPFMQSLPEHLFVSQSRDSTLFVIDFIYIYLLTTANLNVNLFQTFFNVLISI
jgi:hypothetical protein